MNHLMLDFETLGVGTFPALLSVGAVLFDPVAKLVAGPPAFDGNGVAVGCFYRTISPRSCLDFDATIDDATLRFWMEQPPAARAAAFGGTAGVSLVMGELLLWCERHRPKHIWSHGATFDVAILNAYLERLKLPSPFAFYDVRDTRTLFALAAGEGERWAPEVSLPAGFVKHHPLWDAWLQAQQVVAAYRALGR